MTEILQDSRIINSSDIRKDGLVTEPSISTQQEIQKFLSSEEYSSQLEYFIKRFAPYAKENRISDKEILVGATAVLGLHRTMLEHAQYKSAFTTGEVSSLLKWTLREEHFRTGGAVKLNQHDLLKFCTDPDPNKKIINGDNEHNYSL